MDMCSNPFSSLQRKVLDASLGFAAGVSRSDAQMYTVIVVAKVHIALWFSSLGDVSCIVLVSVGSCH